MYIPLHRLISNLSKLLFTGTTNHVAISVQPAIAICTGNKTKSPSFIRRYLSLKMSTLE